MLESDLSIVRHTQRLEIFYGLKRFVQNFGFVSRYRWFDLGCFKNLIHRLYLVKDGGV